MRFVHASTTHTAELTSFTDKTGWEHLLVVMKATYAIPHEGQEPSLLPPEALAMKDTFAGEAGLSAPLQENDFASRKARCDVIFNAQAHAPPLPSGEIRPVKELDVLAQVGQMVKAIHVVGNRRWEKDILLTRHSEPQPFTTMPLHYGRAFGGCVPYTEDDKTLYASYPANPVGTGYSSRKEFATLHGMPLPNLEIPGRPLRRPDEPYPPWALSPIARNFHPRYTFAGTYDQHWRDNTAPFLPDDFDERFFQCAPADQQIPYPQGGEEVRLINMMAGRPDVRFCLPHSNNDYVRVMFQNGKALEIQANLDTIYIETEKNRFSLVWRKDILLPRAGLNGVHVVAVGPICTIWWEAIQRWKRGCPGCEQKICGQQLPAGCPDKSGFPAIEHEIINV